MRGEQIIPGDGAKNIAPTVVEREELILAKAAKRADLGIKVVGAHIESGENAATVGEAVSKFGVDVVEIVASIETVEFVIVGGKSFNNRLHKKVGIGAPSRERKGSAVLDDRAFESHLGRDEAQRSVAMESVEIAVVGGHVENAGETSAKTGREAALVECDILDSIGIESGEKTAEVIDIVERDAIEKIEILVGAAAADIHAARDIGSALDARKKL